MIGLLTHHPDNDNKAVRWHHFVSLAIV